jgi:hypothetical protein
MFLRKVDFHGTTRHYIPEDISLPNIRILLFTWFMLISCLVYTSTLKIEAIYSSEASVDFQRVTRRYKSS